MSINAPLKPTRLQLTTIAIALVTILVRGFSLLRDSLLANTLGLSTETDLFFLLLDWSNLVTTLVATAAINLVIPRLKSCDSESNDYLLSLQKFSSLFLLKILLTVILVSGLYLILRPFEFGLALLALFIFLSQSYCHYFSSILNLKGFFLVPSLLFGLPIFATFLFFVFGWTGAKGLLFLFSMGSLLQLVAVFALVSIKFGHPFAIKKEHFASCFSDLKSWLWLAAATLYFPISSLLNVQLGYFEESGTVSMVSYACRVPFAIANILIFAFWTVALPSSSISSAEPWLQRQDFLRLVKISSVTLVISLLGYFMSEGLVELLYGYKDSILAEDLAAISAMQKIYFIVMTVQVFVSLLIRFLHITGKTLQTLYVCSLGVALQIGCFYWFDLHFESIPLGFALNFAVVGLILTGLTLVDLRKAKAIAGDAVLRASVAKN